MNDILLKLILVLSVAHLAAGFGPSSLLRRASSHQSSFAGKITSLLHARVEKNEDSKWLQEFSTASGEVINPYKVLKVSRKATRQEIRQSYVTLSKRYHCDAVRHRSLLPGSCNNMDDVRDEWERIKLAYEILSDEKVRKKYHRHEALADPAGTAWDGISGAGKGLFDLGVFAVNRMTKKSPSSTSAPADQQPSTSTTQQVD
jgi:DnaJ-class molecular chaperone